MSSLSRAGGRESASGPSRQGRDRGGDIDRDRARSGGSWCKGGLSVAVTGPLGRMNIRAVGKKPYVGPGSVGVLVGKQHDT